MVDQVDQHLWCGWLFYSLQHGLVSRQRMAGLGRWRGLDLGRMEVEGMEPHNHQRTAHSGLRTWRDKEPVHWIASEVSYSHHYY